MVVVIEVVCVAALMVVVFPVPNIIWLLVAREVRVPPVAKFPLALIVKVGLPLDWTDNAVFVPA